jgi:RNA recognition motif-containing protein
MSTKLYIGGLPFATTEDSMKAAFSQAGTVTSAKVIVDKMSGRSRGFGFVEMSTEEEAQAAIDMFNGKEFEGRTITVNEARPLEDRPRTGGGNFRRSSGGGRGFGGGGNRGGNDW